MSKGEANTIRKILEVCLHRAGYSVESFSGGAEMFRWLNTAQAAIPDLVFVDLCLPIIDGYAIIRRLKAKQPKGTVFFRREAGFRDLRGFHANADYITALWRSRFGTRCRLLCLRGRRVLAKPAEKSTVRSPDKRSDCPIHPPAPVSPCIADGGCR